MSNVVLNPGVGGSTLGTDQVGGVDYQIVKPGFSDPGNVPVQVSTTNPLPVTAAALPLPAGAATAAKQPALGTAGTPSADVISVQGEVGMTALKVDGSGVTQPVSGTVTTVPPSNASTNIAQVGGAALSEGQKAMAASIPVVLASDQSAVPVSGTVTTTPPANASTNLAQVGGSAISEGQKAMAASLPIVIASDQSAVPVSGTVTTSPPANASTNVAQFGGSAVVTGTGNGGVGVPRVTVSADSFPAALLDATFTTRINTQGQKAMAASTPVVLASDQSSIPVTTTPPANATENITQFGGTNVSTGTGIGGAGIPRVTVSSDSFPASQAVIGATGVQTSGNIAGTGQIVGPVTLNGATRVTILQSGAYAGVSVIAEVSMDAGFVVATSVRPVRINSIFLEAGSTYTLGTNATQGNIVDVGGWAYFRLRCTAYTSGTLAVVLVPSFPSISMVMDVVATGNAANGAVTTGLPVWVAGSDGANVRALLTDVNGQQIVNQGTPGASAWPVSAASLPLPSGAAQESGNLASIQTALQRLIDLQTQMLAVLQAMHAQDGNLTGQPVDPSNFLSEQYLQ